MNVIRAVFNYIEEVAGKNFRIFTSAGRPDEVITGRIMQHYGYMSKPPLGLDHVCLQYGDNNISVAETSGASNITLNHGDVIIFTDPNSNGDLENSIYLAAPADGVDGVSIGIFSDGTISIDTPKAGIIMDKDGVIEIKNDNGTISMATNGTVSINGGNLSVQAS
jgi:hypothetical protein